MKMYNKIMEVFWLIMGVVSFAIAIYHVSTLGLSDAYLYLLIPILPWGMYYLRRSYRKKMENKENNH